MSGKLLLTNCGHSEMPLIFAARELGWKIVTTGKNANGVGHALADEVVLGDFSDVDFIYNLAKEKKVDAIVSGCEDSAYVSAAYACEKLGLPGHDTYETARIIHNKTLFRKVMRELSLPVPAFEICESIDAAKNAAARIGFPLLIKPPDMNSGIGITICRGMNEIETAFLTAKKSTKAREMIIEKYIEGTRHAANVFFKNQRIFQSFFDDEQYYINQYLVAGASSPSGLRHYTMTDTLIQLEKIAGLLNLADGMFHVQFIADKNGTPYLIDPCRRIPGGLYLLLEYYSGGFNCAEAVVRFETGDPVKIPAERGSRRFIAREYIMTDRSGILDDIIIDKSISEKITDKFIWAKHGDEVKDPMNYKAGILYMEFSNYREMQDALSNFYNSVRVKFK